MNIKICLGCGRERPEGSGYEMRIFPLNPDGTEDTSKECVTKKLPFLCKLCMPLFKDILKGMLDIRKPEVPELE